MVDAEFERALHGDKPLPRRDLVRDRPQQGGLPGVGRPGDHDVLPGGRGGGQEIRQLGQQRPVADQVSKEHLAKPGPADGNRGPQRHVHDRGQPRAVRQPQVKLRVGGVEGAARQARVGGKRLDQLDEFLVAVGHRLDHDFLAVGVAEEHLVAAVDVDILYPLVLEQRLQPPDAEQRGMHPDGELFFLLRGERGPAGGDLGAGVPLQGLRDERPGELPLVLRRHGRQAGCRVQPPLRGQPVADLAAQPLDQAMVHPVTPFPRARRPQGRAAPRAAQRARGRS